MTREKQEVDINIKIDLANLMPSIKTESVEPSNKIKTSLTVSQIAYIAKLLFDTNILSPDNKSEALNKLTNCLVTKNAAQISIKSLKAKFYSPDSGTKLSVKKLLQTLAESIDVYE